MKIIHVLHGFPPEVSGGTERVVEALARAMAAAGHDVTVLCGSLEVASVRRVDEYDHAGLRVLRVHRDDLYFESWWKAHHPGVSETIAGLFAREKPDVVHVHHWLRLTSDIARLAREAGARAVVTAHDYWSVLARVVSKVWDDELEPPPGDRFMSKAEVYEDFAMHRADFADELRAAHVRLAPSRAHAEGLARFLVDDLPFGVTPPPLLELPPRLRHEPVPGGHRLVTWGSLYPDKGLETVLDGMRASGTNFSLDVFGAAHDPEYDAELRNFATGIDVRFHGAYGIEDLAGVEADYAVLPSLAAESYGLVMDEAHALGLPVIASDLPAYREHCQEDACLFLEPGDAAGYTLLFLDPDRLMELRRPAPPKLTSPEDAAADLLRRYAEADTSASFEPDRGLERRRAEALMRRAERRLYAALNAGQLVVPPDDFPPH